MVVISRFRLISPHPLRLAVPCVQNTPMEESVMYVQAEAGVTTNTNDPIGRHLSKSLHLNTAQKLATAVRKPAGFYFCS